MEDMDLVIETCLHKYLLNACGYSEEAIAHTATPRSLHRILKEGTHKVLAPAINTIGVGTNEALSKYITDNGILTRVASGSNEIFNLIVNIPLENRTPWMSFMMEHFKKMGARA